MKDWLIVILKRTVPTGTVVQRAVRSGLWVGATKFAVRFLEILMLIILARLLSPRDFGLLGIALLTLTITNSFTQMGLKQALIQQKRENVDSHLDTMWCLEIGRGVLIFSVLFLSAPYIAAFFSEPAATPLIRVLALGPILFGLRNPGVVYFQKNLHFHKEFLYKTCGSVTQFLVGVGYALYSPTVWALIFASVSKPFSKMFMSYLIHDYRPWPAFDMAAAKDLINFGKWITGSAILQWLYREGDDAFVGWFLSATALGFYQYAYRLADTPATEVSGIISKVTFPTYSTLQEDLDELRSALLQSTRFVSFLAFPIGFGIVLVAPSFVPLVLGPDWTPMILTMQILAIYGVVHAIARNFGELWKALGRPDLLVKTGILRVICIAIVIWPATARWGIEGTGFAITAVFIFPMLPIDVYLAAVLVNGRSAQIYKEYVYPFAASLIMFLVLWYARVLMSVSPIVELLVLVPSGVLLYGVAVYGLERRFDWGVNQNFQMILNSIRE